MKKHQDLSMLYRYYSFKLLLSILLHGCTMLYLTNSLSVEILIISHFSPLNKVAMNIIV